MRVFVSFVQENAAVADYIYKTLKNNGIDAWFCKESLLPGDDFRQVIRREIQSGAYYVPIFSREWASRKRSVANEELAIAIGEMRQRLDQKWFVPLSIDGELPPDIEIYPGKSLSDFHCENLSSGWRKGLVQFLKSLGVSDPVIDSGEPLVPGMASSMRFRSGKIIYKSSNVPMPLMDGLIVTIKDGWCRREKDGSILARVESYMPVEKLDQLNKITGLDHYFLSSDADFISSSPECKSIFLGKSRQLIPAGLPVPDISGGPAQAFESDVEICSDFQAAGWVTGHKFEGDFSVLSNMKFPQMSFELSMGGRFEIELMEDYELDIRSLVS